MTTYRMRLRCDCSEDKQEGTADTDDAGLAMMRKGDMICSGCYGYYTVLAAWSIDEPPVSKGAPSNER